MLIKQWMTAPVITVGPDDSMMKASKLMKDKSIRRLPVVDPEGRLLGIVTDRDVKEASPSKATTLDVHELYYLLSEVKVKDIMSKNPSRLKPEDSVEHAAMILLEQRVGGLPVVDDQDKVVGIITDVDLFRVLIELTRVRDGGVQMGFRMQRTPGEFKPVMEALVAHGANLLSIIMMYPKGQPERQIFVRIDDMPESQLKQLKADMAEKYEMLFFVRDKV